MNKGAQWLSGRVLFRSLNDFESKVKVTLVTSHNTKTPHSIFDQGCSFWAQFYAL